MQCDREALEANIARLSAEQSAAAAAAASSSAEAAVRAAAAMLEVVDEGVQADEPGSTTADDAGLPEATAARQPDGEGRDGFTTRSVDDGFGGSLSSVGSSKQGDTPRGDDATTASTAVDAGRRQQLFVVTNPTVDYTSASAPAAAAEAAYFESSTDVLTQPEGTASCWSL